MRRMQWVAAVVAIACASVGVAAPSGAAPMPPPPTTFNERFTSFPLTVNGSYTPLVGALSCTPSGGDFAIIWYAPGATADYRWTNFDVTEGGLEHTSAPLTVNGTYQPFVGDFDGDACDDIFWFAPGAAADFVWYGTPSGGFTSRPVTAPDDTPLVGDWDDGHIGDDIFWYGEGGGTETIWVGRTDRTFISTSAPQVSGTDFITRSLGGGVLFYRPGAGADYLWDGVRVEKTVPDQSIPVTITGTYEPYVVTGILLYGPGTALDKLITGVSPTGTLTTVPGTINGTYRVAVPPPTASSLPAIVFHAPGPAPDYLWTPALA